MNRLLVGMFEHRALPSVLLAAALAASFLVARLACKHDPLGRGLQSIAFYALCCWLWGVHFVVLVLCSASCHKGCWHALCLLVTPSLADRRGCGWQRFLNYVGGNIPLVGLVG